MDTQYAEQYRELFEKHWWWRARTDVIIETLRQMRASNKWGRILDVGCGDGLFFPRLGEFGAVEGIEPASQIVNARNENRIYSCSFDENFRPPYKYSLILMLDVLEHLPDPLRALSHARRLLEPNGVLLITVPAFIKLWTNHDVLNHHFTRYTKASLCQLTANAGLRVTNARYFFYWMVAAKLIVRVLERAFSSKPKLPHVPRGWINWSLYSISRTEQKILGKLPVPLGSSLIAVVEAQ